MLKRLALAALVLGATLAGGFITAAPAHARPPACCCDENGCSPP